MEKNNYLKISKMEISDLEEIKFSLESDFDDFWDYTTLKSELSSPFSKYIVAKIQDNTVVGFAGIKIVLDQADLMNIVTKKSMRNLGIGSALLDYLVSMCKKENIKLLNLEVNAQNSIAISLYKKYNFKEVGLRKKYYDNTYDAILMSLDI